MIQFQFLKEWPIICFLFQQMCFSLCLETEKKKLKKDVELISILCCKQSNAKSDHSTVV